MAASQNAFQAKLSGPLLAEDFQPSMILSTNQNLCRPTLGPNAGQTTPTTQWALQWAAPRRSAPRPARLRRSQRSEVVNPSWRRCVGPVPWLPRVIFCECFSSLDPVEEQALRVAPEARVLIPRSRGRAQEASRALWSGSRSCSGRRSSAGRGWVARAKPGTRWLAGPGLGAESGWSPPLWVEPGAGRSLASSFGSAKLGETERSGAAGGVQRRK